MAELLTIREFAGELRGSIATVRSLINRGIIPVFKARHFIRIDRDAALEALRTHAAQSLKPDPVALRVKRKYVKKSKPIVALQDA